MKTNTETYKVLINGDEFCLVSDEAEEHVTQAAEKVSAIIHELSSQGSQVDKQKAAILAAVQLASELLHTKRDLDQHKQRESDLVSFVEHTITSL